MKRKIFYFIISCFFAVITSANVTNNIDTVFKERTVQSSILNNEGRKKGKDYTSIILNRVEPVKRIVLKNNFDEYTTTDYEEIEIEKNSIKNNRLIEKSGDSPPYYTILYRYRSRILRI